MPEGDTLFKLARTLRAALEGRAVERFETGLAQLARIDRESPIAGRAIERVESRGKHLLIRFNGGLTLRTHLRMNGAWHLYPRGAKWHMARSRARIVIETAEYVAVGFDIPVADFFDDAQLERELATLGPDLLADDFDPARALANLRALPPATAIAEALLDQRVMAGIGNVYKSEILFLERAHPNTAVGALDDAKLASIIATSRKVLRLNTSGPRRTTGRMRRGEELFVYGRAGRPCRRCGTPIAQDHRGLSARVTTWCPKCQPAP